MAIIECRASQAEPNMSCLAGKGGKLEATGGWTAGLLRPESVMAELAIFSKTAQKISSITGRDYIMA